MSYNITDPQFQDAFRLRFIETLETTTHPQIFGCERDEHGGRCPVGLLNDVVTSLDLDEQSDVIFRDVIGKGWIRNLLAYNDGMELTFSEIAQKLRSHWGLLTPDPSIATFLAVRHTPTETAAPSTPESNEL